ncbi:gag-Pol polyprotein [Trichonephila clavipes]|nr:gag-Pol polyprotein [Trichonephila clavipes]
MRLLEEDMGWADGFEGVALADGEEFVYETSNSPFISLRAVGSLVVRASDSRPEGLGSMLDVTKYPPSAYGVRARYSLAEIVEIEVVSPSIVPSGSSTELKSHCQCSRPPRWCNLGNATSVTAAIFWRLLRDKFRPKKISTVTQLAVGKSWSPLLYGQRRAQLLALPRVEGVACFRVITGHDYLQAHLFKIDLTDSPLCPLCKTVPMTEENLFDCPSILHALSQDGCRVPPANATSALYWTARRLMSERTLAGKSAPGTWSNSGRVGCRIVLLKFPKSVRMHNGHEWVQVIRQDAYVPFTVPYNANCTCPILSQSLHQIEQSPVDM